MKKDKKDCRDKEYLLFFCEKEKKMVSNADQSSFELIPTIDNERLTNAVWDMISTSVYNPNDFSQIKLRIRSFVRDHPSIVYQLDRCLFDLLLDHFFKKSFRVQFTQRDREETEKYVQEVINEQYSNIGIILSYFLNDIRWIILTGNYSNVPWSIRQVIIHSPDSMLIQAIRTGIYLKGSQKITNTLFESLLNSNEQINSSSFELNEQNVKMFLLVLSFLLISLNVSSVGFVINWIGIILFVLLMFIYSLIYLKRFV